MISVRLGLINALTGIGVVLRLENYLNLFLLISGLT